MYLSFHILEVVALKKKKKKLELCLVDKKKITNAFVHINYHPKTFVYKVLNPRNFNGRGLLVWPLNNSICSED